MSVLRSDAIQNTVASTVLCYILVYSQIKQYALYAPATLKDCYDQFKRGAGQGDILQLPTIDLTTYQVSENAQKTQVTLTGPNSFTLTVNVPLLTAIAPNQTPVFWNDPSTTTVSIGRFCLFAYNNPSITPPVVQVSSTWEYPNVQTATTDYHLYAGSILYGNTGTSPYFISMIQ